MSAQPTLFGSPDAYGGTQSPSLPEAAQAGADAQESDVRHAEADAPGFAERAKAVILAHLAAHGPTPSEDLTDACLAAGIVPDELRAFGAVFGALSRAGLIYVDGFRRRRRGHSASGGNVWRLRETK